MDKNIAFGKNRGLGEFKMEKAQIHRAWIEPACYPAPK